MTSLHCCAARNGKRASDVDELAAVSGEPSVTPSCGWSLNTLHLLATTTSHVEQALALVSLLSRTVLILCTKCVHYEIRKHCLDVFESVCAQKILGTVKVM